MVRLLGHNKGVHSYNVAEAKTHLSEILDRVLEGEEVLLTRRGKPLAKVVPVARDTSILGAGRHDSNIQFNVIAEDKWWRSSIQDEELQDWYE